MGGHGKFWSLGVLLALTLGGAQASDLPTHKPAPIPIAPVLPFSWTGPFLGLQGGYAWDGEEVYVPWVWHIPYSVERHGGFGGVVGGYDYQWGNFVVGVEADYNLANVTGGAAVRSTYITTNRVSSFGSVDLKLGYAFDRLLVYGLGGLGLMDANHTLDDPFVPFSYGSYNTFGAGWNAGAGVQYAFTNAWSAFVEFRHYRNPSTYFPILPVLGPHSTTETLSNVRFGIVYKFGS